MAEEVKTSFKAFDKSNFIKNSGRPTIQAFHDIGLIYTIDNENEILKEYFIFDKR